jgi:hypothetical protein
MTNNKKLKPFDKVYFIIQTQPMFVRSAFTFTKEDAKAIQLQIKAMGIPSKIVSFSREELEGLEIGV